MAEKKSRRTTKRFGARYGSTNRKKRAKVEALQKVKYKCPNCNYPKSKRLAAGIWYCSKCEKKFTSKAYQVQKLQKLTSEVQEEL